jgi:glycerol-3-phosphate acyltransferase PlsY
MTPCAAILLLAGAYLVGAVPFGWLTARFVRGVDIRTTGSGNIGATNAARVLGARWFPVVFTLDMLKGAGPVLAMRWLLASAGGPARFEPAPLVVAAALAAILGHVFPVWLGFKGGKAVATGTGVFLVLTPRAALVAAAVWIALFALFRYVSLASISAAPALAAAATFLFAPDPFGRGIFLTLFCWAGAALVVLLHRANIRRLLAGTEHRIGRPRAPRPPGD